MPPPAPNSWPTSIRMSDGLKADLKRIADAYRSTVPTLIRKALEEFRDAELPKALELRKRKKA